MERFQKDFNEQCFPIKVNFGSKCQTWQQIDYLGSKSSKSRTQVIVSSKSAKLNVNMSGKTERIFTFEELNTFSMFVHIKYA